uniref:Uncharacterized protein n=1 Tax=Octopus bimaculoides TaxID=37653 RepID=A0A0L8HC08_OCTBM
MISIVSKFLLEFHLQQMIFSFVPSLLLIILFFLSSTTTTTATNLTPLPTLVVPRFLRASPLV